MTASHNFAQVPRADIQRSTFDRSHGLKTTGDADDLNVLFVDEVLPGDTFKLKTNLFGRLATPINPIMDNMYLDTFYFFVPTRLLWDNFKRFMGEQTDPGDSIDYTVPTYTGRSVTTATTLLDQMGLPITTGLDLNILPIRAYWLIYDEWFRDQNLQDSAEIYRTDTGSQVITNTVDYTWNQVAKRGKRHDYFTSCLPWTQKGDQVTIPLGSTAQIAHDVADGTNLGVYSTANAGYKLMDTTASYLHADAGNTTQANSLYADLTTATGATINGWRQAFQIQKFLERDARGGTRYIEKVYSHFGVTSPDARLQRPEYLGGSSQPINVNPVPQTSSTDATTPQGNMSAFGTVSENNSGFTKSFTEHGYIIGLWNVRADITYQQGVDKLWSRSTQYDFYFPTFAHLGEQAVLNKEIYHQGTADDENVFGYQERYSEYRYKPSKITGLFRSGATGTLDPWHLSEEFSSLPALNDTFIKSNTPLDRCIAVPSEPHLILDCYFNLRCTRPMPVYSPPGLIDHF
jgi:hypothetical protein